MERLLVVKLAIVWKQKNKMLTHTHLSQIDKKGYTLIENFLNLKEVNLWIDFFKQMGNEIKRDIINEKRGIKRKYKEATIVIDPYKGQRHLSKIQRTMIQTKQGKDFIDRGSKLLQSINPNLIFFKDRYIIQAPGMPGLLPHQDNSAVFHEEIARAYYTIYIALTPTTEEGGCLFVENLPKKRIKNLGMCDVGCVQLDTECACAAAGVGPEEIKNYKGYNMKPIPMSAGDCIILDGWILHGTALNNGNSFRKTLTINYIEPKDSVQKLNRDYINPREDRLIAIKNEQEQNYVH